MSKKDKVKKLDNPHDKIFKRTFGEIEVAREFLKNYLPNEILNIIDLKNITHEKETHVREDLQEFYSDMLFRTNMNDEESYIYAF